MNKAVQDFITDWVTNKEYHENDLQLAVDRWLDTLSDDGAQKEYSHTSIQITLNALSMLSTNLATGVDPEEAFDKFVSMFTPTVE